MPCVPLIVVGSLQLEFAPSRLNLKLIFASHCVSDRGEKICSTYRVGCFSWPRLTNEPHSRSFKPTRFRPARRSWVCNEAFGWFVTGRSVGGDLFAVDGDTASDLTCLSVRIFCQHQNFCNALPRSKLDSFLERQRLRSHIPAYLLAIGGDDQSLD